MRTKIKLSWALPLLILIAGLYSAFVRVFKGLGASTHMSDRFPWGLWISFDMLSGVALAAGAFMLSGAVYVLHLERYRPLVRSAILTGFIGYLAAIIGLMFDLGHPYRIWHPLVMWNPHSVMFEISWCVTLYTTVLAMEFSAFLFERLGWKFAFRTAHALTIPLVMVGVILSTLHQSSLGSLFLAVPFKLHPLWYTPWLPVFFFLSALAIGCAMVIIESFASSKTFKMELEIDLLSDLGRVLVVALSLYGIARFMDLSDRGVLGLMQVRGFERTMFLAEILLTIFGPLVLLLMPYARRNRLGLFMGAAMVVVGFILNRFNVSMTGIIRSSGTKYIPSWMELSVTFMVVFIAITVFGVAARYLNIFPMAKPCLEEGQSCRDKPTCCLSTGAKLWATGVWVGAGVLLAIGVRDFRAFTPVGSSAETTGAPSSIAVRQASYPNLPKDFTFAKSENSPGTVRFSHESHVMFAERCADCHSARFSIILRGGSGRDMHDIRYCGACHDGKAAGNECAACHVDDVLRK